MRGALPFYVAWASALVVGAAACDPPATPVAKTTWGGGDSPVVVTILYTADEHGWLLPFSDHGMVRGGAAEALGQWLRWEGHCPGPPRVGVWELDACEGQGTLLLSGGDNFTGPAISSYFRGEPMAAAMRRMGYAASALGNHELDFGREQLIKNRDLAGVHYLAANLVVKDPQIKGLDVEPFRIFERRGVKIGVVGLALEVTLQAAKASNFDGLAFADEEASLDKAVAGAWGAGADAVVVIAHECPDKLQPMVARHPEWRLSFVGGGHCHEKMILWAGGAGAGSAGNGANARGVPVIMPGWRLSGYARVRLTVDKRRPARERVLEVAPEVVEVAMPEHAARSHDPSARTSPTPSSGMPWPALDKPIDELRGSWGAKVEVALGERVGFTAAGLAMRSPEMAQWVAGAWREELKTDVAIVNRGGLRQEVPPGPISKAIVYSVLPFDNELYICSLTGEALLETLANEKAMAAGVVRSPSGGYSLEGGGPIDPARRYTVATIDYLYFGGSGFLFKKHDPRAKGTGIDWRAPVIAWTKRQQTSPEAPLEARLRR